MGDKRRKDVCTNAAIAEYILTLVRTDPAGGSRSLSLILVPIGTPGLKVGKPEKKMGLHGSPTSAVTYDDVRVPLDHLLGNEGDGLHQALATLDAGRISIAAMSVGLAQAAFEHATAYAKERKAFGQSIGRFEAIQWMLAEAATEISTARLLTYRAAWLKELGRAYTKEAAMAKMYASEMGERVCRNAIQVHGGYGYSREIPGGTDLQGRAPDDDRRGHERDPADGDRPQAAGLRASESITRPSQNATDRVFHSLGSSRPTLRSAPECCRTWPGQCRPRS